MRKITFLIILLVLCCLIDHPINAQGTDDNSINSSSIKMEDSFDAVKYQNPVDLPASNKESDPVESKETLTEAPKLQISANNRSAEFEEEPASDISKEVLLGDHKPQRPINTGHITPISFEAEDRLEPAESLYPIDLLAPETEIETELDLPKEVLLGAPKPRNPINTSPIDVEEELIQPTMIDIDPYAKKNATYPTSIKVERPLVQPEIVEADSILIANCSNFALIEAELLPEEIVCGSPVNPPPTEEITVAVAVEYRDPIHPPTSETELETELELPKEVLLGAPKPRNPIDPPPTDVEEELIQPMMIDIDPYIKKNTVYPTPIKVERPLVHSEIVEADSILIANCSNFALIEAELLPEEIVCGSPVNPPPTEEITVAVAVEYRDPIHPLTSETELETELDLPKEVLLGTSKPRNPIDPPTDVEEGLVQLANCSNFALIENVPLSEEIEYRYPVDLLSSEEMTAAVEYRDPIHPPNPEAEIETELDLPKEVLLGVPKPKNPIDTSPTGVEEELIQPTMIDIDSYIQKNPINRTPFKIEEPLIQPKMIYINPSMNEDSNPLLNETDETNMIGQLVVQPGEPIIKVDQLECSVGVEEDSLKTVQLQDSINLIPTKMKSDSDNDQSTSRDIVEEASSFETPLTINIFGKDDHKSSSTQVIAASAEANGKKPEISSFERKIGSYIWYRSYSKYCCIHLICLTKNLYKI